VVVEELRDTQSDGGGDADEGDGGAGRDVPARCLDHDQHRAEQNGTDPAHRRLADLEDDGDQGGDQLDDEKQRASDGSADPREEGRDRRTERAQPAPRLEERAAEPDPQILLRPNCPPRLPAAATGHRPGLGPGPLGELVLAAARALAASQPAADSLPGSHHAAAIIIRRSGVPRRAPWALTVSMENGAT
jgi:hypothetical protein